MQLFLVTPAVIAVYQKSTKLGYSFCGLLIATCLILRATSVTDYNILYYRTHLRMAAYFVGVLFYFIRKQEVFAKEMSLLFKWSSLLIVPMYLYYHQNNVLG